MAEYVLGDATFGSEENIREIFIDLEELPAGLVYKLDEGDFTFSSARFGFDEWKEIDYYLPRMPKGLLQQFPCLEYMLTDYWEVATRHTPLDEIEYRKQIAEAKEE
jgi:hypothetical protein